MNGLSQEVSMREKINQNFVNEDRNDDDRLTVFSDVGDERKPLDARRQEDCLSFAEMLLLG